MKLISEVQGSVVRCQVHRLTADAVHMHQSGPSPGLAERRGQPCPVREESVQETLGAECPAVSSEAGVSVFGSLSDAEETSN